MEQEIEKNLEYLKETDYNKYLDAIELLSGKNTPQVSKDLGAMLGIAPKKVDNIIGGI